MTSRASPRNLLLSRLSPEDIALLGPMTKVDLALSDPLETADMPIQFIYFMETGLASVVETVAGQGAAEVGVIGFEGMSGSAILFGDTQSPFDTYTQCQGTALRIDASQLRMAIAASASLQAQMLLYARAFTIQVATTAFANGRASLVERLARWLLMIGDRVGDTLHITHEYLSTMLAVRRTGVTEALQALESQGIILNTRGKIHILDRALLVETSGGSYGRAESEYRRLLDLSEIRFPTDRPPLDHAA